MRHHAEGDRPLVLVPEDLPRVEAVPLAGRRLPASTNELLQRTAADRPHSPALHLLGAQTAGAASPVNPMLAEQQAALHATAIADMALGHPA